MQQLVSIKFVKKIFMLQRDTLKSLTLEYSFAIMSVIDNRLIDFQKFKRLSFKKSGL